MQKYYYFLTKCHKILQFFDSPIAIYTKLVKDGAIIMKMGPRFQTVFSNLNKKSANIIIFKNAAFLLWKRWREVAPHLFFPLPFKFPDWAGFVKFHELSTSSLYQVRAIVPFVHRACIVPTNSAFSGNSLDNYYRTSVLWRRSLEKSFTS